ncbi:Hypothetical predicted protein [Olea europaea subsp. europaea]|uniref:Uncharacterized protein n=1 Tax=Olea europaea subsp. europaea TaxID=158383 RepID=A0A8S0UYY6_OLEEU|nr:Hypothetical predicted protein [Olea europaea subsp. europaea]
MQAAASISDDTTHGEDKTSGDCWEHVNDVGRSPESHHADKPKSDNPYPEQKVAPLLIAVRGLRFETLVYVMARSVIFTALDLVATGSHGLKCIGNHNCRRIKKRSSKTNKVLLEEERKMLQEEGAIRKKKKLAEQHPQVKGQFVRQAKMIQLLETHQLVRYSTRGQ